MLPWRRPAQCRPHPLTLLLSPSSSPPLHHRRLWITMATRQPLPPVVSRLGSPAAAGRSQTSPPSPPSRPHPPRLPHCGLLRSPSPPWFLSSRTRSLGLLQTSEATQVWILSSCHLAVGVFFSSVSSLLLLRSLHRRRFICGVLLLLEGPYLLPLSLSADQPISVETCTALTNELQSCFKRATHLYRKVSKASFMGQSE